MNARRWAWRAALVAAGLLAGLILFLPLRVALSALALDQAGLSARAVSGTMWNGRIEDMRLGRLSVGTVDAGLAPLPLLLGRARLAMAPAEDRPGPSGALVVSRHLVGVDVNGSVSAGGLFGALPVGSVELDAVRVRFVDGVCVEASGRVRARLVGAGALLGLVQGFEGPLRCAGRALATTLSSQSGQARLVLRIEGNARYRADVIVAEPDAAVAPLLRGAGFVAVPGGFRLRASGTLG